MVGLRPEYFYFKVQNAINFRLIFDVNQMCDTCCDWQQSTTDVGTQPSSSPPSSIPSSPLPTSAATSMPPHVGSSLVDAHQHWRRRCLQMPVWCPPTSMSSPPTSASWRPPTLLSPPPTNAQLTPHQRQRHRHLQMPRRHTCQPRTPPPSKPPMCPSPDLGMWADPRRLQIAAEDLEKREALVEEDPGGTTWNGLQHVTHSRFLTLLSSALIDLTMQAQHTLPIAAAIVRLGTRIKVTTPTTIRWTPCTTLIARHVKYHHYATSAHHTHPAPRPPRLGPSWHRSINRQRHMFEFEHTRTLNICQM